MGAQFSNEACRKKLKNKSSNFSFFHLKKLSDLKVGNPDSLPFSIKILLESALRNYDNYQVTFEDITRIFNWKKQPRTPKR